MTVSIRNTPGMLDAFDELAVVWRRYLNTARMRKKRGNYHCFNDLVTWIGVTEVKRGLGGWNAHTHLIVISAAEKLPYGLYQSDWKAAAHDQSAHLDFQGPVRKPIRAVAYMAPYLTKPKGIFGGLTLDQAKANATTLFKRRFLKRPRGSAPPAVDSGWDLCCAGQNENICSKWFRPEWIEEQKLLDLWFAVEGSV